jgi:hypothetical protein
MERRTSNGEKRQMKEMTLKKTIDIVPMTNVWHFFAEFLINFFIKSKLKKKYANYTFCWVFVIILNNLFFSQVRSLILNNFGKILIFFKSFFSAIPFANYFVLKTSVVGKVIAGIMEIVMGSMGQAARMMKTKVVWWETRGE